MARSIYLCTFLLFITWIPILSTSFPLSTKTRWIVDEKGQRVKLACVNWPAHLQPAVAEGLSKQPLDSISKKIVSMGFNCVRLTWPLDLMTNDTLALKITVKQSFESLKLFDDALGIQTHNPKILNLPIFNAFQEVVSNLGQNGLMHWYSFSHEGGAWVKHNSNDICAKIIGEVNHNGGFLLDRGFPLILSEFGTDERGVDVSGNRYMNCLVAWAAEKDLDWAVWALTGDYYLRTGPGLQEKKLVLHPHTGLCVTTNHSGNVPALRLELCTKSEPSTFNPKEGILWINKICVETPDVAGQKVKLGVGSKCSKLGQISATKMHLSFKTSNGLLLCLDVDERDNSIVANPCKCLTKDASCDPASQWFKVL
ncbi:hypothetical protein BRARA_B00673 [Brassica rapa]|uniref:Mannan endo-1,4-beta-mannosidase n=1 Tax=Brassica campestris TaxID=3711 RepID=A0A398A6R6_BRACM|nr:hypothetical protein BRARA_B00673 [Brassica rapa]